MLIKNHSPRSLAVLILDSKDAVIDDAKVVLNIVDKVGNLSLDFDKTTGRYVAQDIPGGNGRLTVSHPHLEEQRRDVSLGAGENQETFILGEPGVPTFFRGKVRVPITADEGLIGVTIDRAARDQIDEIDNIGSSMGLMPEEAPALVRAAGVRLYRGGHIDLDSTLEKLTQDPRIQHAGAVVQMRETGFTFLTRDVTVRFVGPRMEEVRRIARKYGFRLQRELVYAPSTYVIQWQRPASFEMLKSIEQLAARNDVEWAEPSLVVSPELDAITPSDPLWPGLWDRQLIGLQNAWQHLQDVGIDTFGDPDIVLAVWDSGTESVAGVPTNTDFSGTVSDGNPKVIATYDFENMVANNDSPWDPHGSGVAGVSVALANNPTPPTAAGVVGSAPNVRIMTIAGRVPYVDIEVADQYIWMTGFDPQSPLAGFPASPPPRGADVITCSLTPGAGAPLSGTAQAALDFVTTFGRGGKGTMCFFSTGNANANNVTARPYGAYEKCFAIAATSLANDGVTEIRAPYSGWGQIDFCTPSQDASPTVHNPPTGYKPWSAAHAGTGNLPSSVVTQTTLNAASAAGTTTLNLTSVAGFAVNSVIHVGAIGALGSEPARITAVNPATNVVTAQGFNGSFWSGGLLNAHSSGDVVVTGPADHKNNFGGTSSATPLAAGVAALVLSANPELTYIEAREVMRNTAVKLDLGNTTANGQWLDINGNPSVTSGLPAVRSGWYGYGRVDAAAAVQQALSFATSRDLVIRDNLADLGTVASAGAFWNSPDIWCRRLAQAVDPGALPANYDTAGPHESPMRGQANWVYLRVRNNGLVASLDAWVRISVTHWPGMEFTYPASWQPTNGPGVPLPSPMTTGTYFIGEAKVSGIAPGDDEIVSVEWPAGLIPPETVSTPMGDVHWHPCLLAEVTPHDGPTPTGNHVWDDNNLAQKNISIVGTDAGSDFAIATVIGDLDNEAKCLYLEINRGRLPKGVRLYVGLMDRLLVKGIREFEIEPIKKFTPVLASRRPVATATIDEPVAVAAIAARLASHSLTGLSWLQRRLRPWYRGWHEGREVVFLRPQLRVQLPICAGPNRFSPLVIGGLVDKDVESGEYEVVLIQRNPDGKLSGSATVMIRIGND